MNTFLRYLAWTIFITGNAFLLGLLIVLSCQNPVAFLVVAGTIAFTWSGCYLIDRYLIDRKR